MFPLSRSLISFAVTSTLILGALAQDGTSTEPPTAVEIAKRAWPTDCEMAQYIWNDVDCHYTFDAQTNSLDYHIYIEPTGQLNPGNKGWCQGIWDNIKGDCGGLGSDSFSCMGWHEKTLHNPVTKKINSFQGLNMQFQWKWNKKQWTQGTGPDADLKSCVTSAIKKATCPAQDGKPPGITYKNDACYMCTQDCESPL